MKTLSELRRCFWATFPEYQKEYRKRKTQNDYKCDIRCSWVDWLDSLAKSGEITRKLAERATL
jgi:hypothetical protein